MIYKMLFWETVLINTPYTVINTNFIIRIIQLNDSPALSLFIWYIKPYTNSTIPDAN